jgi:hypothetical protein
MRGVRSFKIKLLIFLPPAESFFKSNANRQIGVGTQVFCRKICWMTPAASSAPHSTASSRVFHAKVVITTEKDFGDWQLYVFYLSAVPCACGLDSHDERSPFSPKFVSHHGLGNGPAAGESCCGFAAICRIPSEGGRARFFCGHRPLFYAAEKPEKSGRLFENCAGAARGALGRMSRLGVFRVDLGRLLRNVWVRVIFGPPGVALRQPSAGWAFSSGWTFRQGKSGLTVGVRAGCGL